MTMPTQSKLFVYVRAIDLAFFWVKDTMAWERIVQRREHTKEVYEHLSSLHRKQEVIEHTQVDEWRQQLESGELTLEQLRQMLLARYNIEQSGEDSWSKMRSQINEGEITSEQIGEIMKRMWQDEHRATYVDSLVDKVVNAKRFDIIRAAREYRSLRLVISPDGVTDELCYEFRSLKNSSSLKYHLEGIKAVAHIDAYLLQRPKRSKIMAHVHVRTSGREQIVTERTDRDLAQGYLDDIERIIQYFVKRWPDAPKGYWG